MKIVKVARTSHRAKRSEQMIDISQEDFGTLCICALRYCHGRKTYMPSLVQSIVKQHFNDLSARDIQVILNDKRFQQQMSLWGDDCDRYDWDCFYRDLEAFRDEHH